jgi:hypothetical protein
MRARLGASVVAAAILAAVLSVSGLRPAQAGAVYQPETGVGLGELLQSLVDGDNPLITEVESTEVTSPLGGTTTDASGTATLTGTFQFTANIGEFQGLADLDFDGSSDLPTDLVRLGDTGDSFALTDLDGALGPILSVTAPVFDTVQGPIWSQFGLDPDDDGVQDFNGTPIRIAGDMKWSVPSLGVVDVFGGTFAGALPPDLSCPDNIHEFGKAYITPGAMPWDPSVAPNDTFRDLSNAIVTRCNDNFWYVDALSNVGSFFQSVPTNSFSLIWPTGWVTFTDRRETSAIQQYRLFAFRTPLVGGYQQTNTFQTTEPAYPGLREPAGDFLVGTPVTTEFGPFAFELEFTAPPGTPGSCPSGFTAPFELFVDRGTVPGTDNAVLHQFPSGQLTMGRLVFDPEGNVDITTEGSGEGYREMFALGNESTYTYLPDGLECTYDISFTAGNSIAAALLDAGLGRVDAPVDDGEADPETADSSESTPADTESAVTDDEATTPSPDDTPSDSGGAEAEPTADDDGTPWGPILAGIGFLMSAIGFGVTRTRRPTGSTESDDPAATSATPATTTTPPGTPDPCDRLRRLHAAAKTDAETKRAEATEAQEAAEAAGEAEDEANAEAGRADEAAKNAKTARERAERNRDRPPAGEEEAWIEDSETGERITGRDLRLRREAAGEAWDRYRNDPSAESAGQTEQDWQSLDAEGAREGRRSADDTDQATRQKALDDATTAENGANTAKSTADNALDDAERAARDARDAAARAEEAATAAETRAAALKRQLDECLGMTGTGAGATTRWGGPMGLREDADGGCFPEGNVERRVIETFDKTVKVNHWVTVRPTSGAASEARRISGELAWWRDLFATTSSAINVAGAIKGLVTRTPGDLVDTALSGGSVIAGDRLGIDIPTTIYQVPVVGLEGASAASAAIIKAWGGWSEKNHVEWVAQWGYQVRDCKLAWVEIWKCENGVKKCVEHVLEVNLGAPRLTGAVHTETYQPRQRWQPRVDGLTQTHARRVQTDSQALAAFMQKHVVGPCR